MNFIIFIKYSNKFIIMKKNKDKSNDSIDNYLIEIDVDKLKSDRTARHVEQIRQIRKNREKNK